MDSLAGQKLVKADGSSHEADAVLADKELVMYYFSAHWCPPCRQFTPMLKDFYDEVSDENLEIVFVSSDRSDDDMKSYMKVRNLKNILTTAPQASREPLRFEKNK